MGDSVASDQLKSYIERIERLEEEKNNTSEDIKEVYDEAGSSGFDKKIIRKLIALRRRDPDEVKEEEAILDLYIQALGGKIQ